MNANNIPAASHTDCSHSHAGPATITVAYFVLAGLVHKAVRFWRSDYLKTGKVEIYTLEPYHADATTCTELGWNMGSAGEFLRYADETNPSRTDVVALRAIAAASKGTYCPLVADQAERFAAIELH